MLIPSLKSAFGVYLVLSLSSMVSAQSFSPTLNNDWWQIAGNPDLGQLSDPRQQPVDFGIWQASDGTWQVWSCIRKTKELGRTRLFHGWEGSDLRDQDWTPKGIMMRADTMLGEHPGGMQAPYVIQDDGKYKMFYGDWNRICLATSKGGKVFTRALRNGDPSLFGDPEETNTRDAMVIRHDNHWICYYVAHPKDHGAIYARTSKDLLNWSASKRISYGGIGGKGKLWHAECPFVVQRGSYFYLFRTVMYGQKNKAFIYRSKDPLDFGIDDDRHLIGEIPVAAPEIFRYDDKWYIACLLPSLDGIRLGTLDWE